MLLWYKAEAIQATRHDQEHRGANAGGIRQGDEVLQAQQLLLKKPRSIIYV